MRTWLWLLSVHVKMSKLERKIEDPGDLLAIQSSWTDQPQVYWDPTLIGRRVLKQPGLCVCVCACVRMCVCVGLILSGPSAPVWHIRVTTVKTVFYSTNNSYKFKKVKDRTTYYNSVQWLFLMIDSIKHAIELTGKVTNIPGFKFNAKCKMQLTFLYFFIFIFLQLVIFSIAL